MMKEPLGFRGKIPLYYPKSEEEYKRDPYEQYHTVVLRNVRNYFLTDFGNKSIDFLTKTIPSSIHHRTIVELGCGMAYHMYPLSKSYQSDTFIGFDTSYQMLKMAYDLWINNDERKTEIIIPASVQGFPETKIERKSSTNIHLGLSRADLLPMDDESCDVVYSCFLWDRMPDLQEFVQEQKRILKKGGRMIIITPLNYRSEDHWKNWYGVEVLKTKVAALGFVEIDFQEWEEIEQMDIHGNSLHWKVKGMVWEKK